MLCASSKRILTVIELRVFSLEGGRETGVDFALGKRDLDLSEMEGEVKMEREAKVEVEAEMEEGGKVGVVWKREESVLSYEEIRKQRVEENKKRMGELGLHELSKSLQGSKGETSAKKGVKRKMPSEEDQGVARRSSRVAAKPAVTYNEAPVYKGEKGEKLETRHGLPKQYLKEKPRMAAIDAAEEVLKDLRNPAFIKPLLHSHTTGGFWMGLKSSFCKEYLPIEDEKVMLETSGMEWECVYLVGKNGLSGGWRSFSIDNELRDGDSVIFELVNPRRFVVHIFRVAKEESKGAPEAKKERKANKR